jgi:hypothetical protein
VAQAFKCVTCVACCLVLMLVKWVWHRLVFTG